MSDLLFPQLPLWLDIQTFQGLGQYLSKGEWWLLNRIDEGLFLVITMPGFGYWLIGIPHILQYWRQLCPRQVALPRCQWCCAPRLFPSQPHGPWGYVRNLWNVVSFHNVKECFVTGSQWAGQGCWKACRCPPRRIAPHPTQLSNIYQATKMKDPIDNYQSLQTTL